MVSIDQTAIDTNGKHLLAVSMLAQARVFHQQGNHYIAGWLVGIALDVALLVGVQRAAGRRLVGSWDVTKKADYLFKTGVIDQAIVQEIRGYVECGKDCETNARRLPLYSAFPVTVDQVAEMLAGVEALQTRLLPEGDAATDGT